MKIYLKNWIKLQLLAISLPFSVFIWNIFPPGSGTAADPCGSGSTALSLGNELTKNNYVPQNKKCKPT